MTKHFTEEGGSCFIGEHQYTLKQLVEMEEGELPKLPPEYESLVYLHTMLGVHWILKLLVRGLKD